MFIKIVVILLLLIVAASLLGSRSAQGKQRGGRLKPNLRTLMLRVAAALLTLAVIVAALHLSGCDKPGPAFHSTDISGARFGRLAALDALTDHNGRRFASTDLRGKVVVVFFGYIQCPDICPTKLVSLQETMRLLGPAADRVQVLFVTVDPERDTRDVLAAYMPWFDTHFLGLFGDAAATFEIAQEFRIFYTKVTGETALGYSLDHSATSYVYDPQGRLRLLIRYGETPARIAADLRQLLNEAGP